MEGFNRQIGDIIAERLLKKLGEDFIDSVVLYLFHVDSIVGYALEMGWLNLVDSTCRWFPLDGLAITWRGTTPYTLKNRPDFFLRFVVPPISRSLMVSEIISRIDNAAPLPWPWDFKVWNGDWKSWSSAPKPRRPARKPGEMVSWRWKTGETPLKKETWVNHNRWYNRWLVNVMVKDIVNMLMLFFIYIYIYISK